VPIRESLEVAVEPGARLGVSYLRAGQREAARVVFLHGTPGKAEDWWDYLDDPPPGLELVALDRPGFGQSRPRRALPPLAAQARAVAPFLVERAAGRTIVVGHSLGAAVAAQLAVDCAARVGGLLLVAGSLDPALERVYRIQHLGTRRGVEWLLPAWARHSNRELIELEGHLRALAPRLAEVQCPVVILHGTRDPLVPYENVAFMRLRFSGSVRVESVQVAGGDHFLPWNAQARVREGLARVIELCADAGAPG